MRYQTPIFLQVLFWAACCPLLLPAQSKESFLTQSTVEKAQQIAAKEQKLIYAHFTADWCMPCRWMEENTYSDSRIRHYLSQHYYPIQVNIEDLEGYNDKVAYGIEMLPTVLLFDAGGKQVARFEESLSAKRLLEILRQYNIPANRYAGAISGPVGPDLPTPQAGTGHLDRPPLGSTASQPTDPASDWERPYTEAVLPSPTNSVFYSIQVGAFSNYENVIPFVRKLESQIKEQVQIESGDETKGPRFKILVGRFDSRARAQQYLNDLSSKGISGYVREVR